jgi:site-specific DNA-cytosine methylase
VKVLVACEFSGIVRDAFIARGHDALSCDLIPSERGGPHYTGDVRDVITESWDLMVAHPPCTHLAVSGARWFKGKQREQEEALDLVRLLLEANIPKVCLENPVSVISSRIRKPDQIIQPFQFGHAAYKTTCLWLKGLPPLQWTNVVDPGGVRTFPNGKRMSEYYYQTSLGKHSERGHERSRTFQGIADAMAEQWTD